MVIKEFKSFFGSSQKKNGEPDKTEKEAYAGKILKCPSCGEIISPLDMKCPTCGNEIRHEQNPAMVEFTKQINLLESKGKKKAEISYINNFVIPNDKATIYELLIYIKSKINNFDVAVKPSTAHLLNAWVQKINEIKDKGELLFQNDEFISSKHEEVMQCYKKIKKNTRLFIIKLRIGM